MTEKNQSPFQEKLSNLPAHPGVYLFKNATDHVIYIGKAKVLRNRVRSYFQKSRSQDAKTRRMVAQVCDFEIILTDSEVEALILEANLVKQYRPHYNINLKDDKSYPYIRITNEPFPRIFPTRRIIKDGSLYFGPYTDVGTMRQLLKTVKAIFPIRSCRLPLKEENVQAGKFRVCLNYHIQKCPGPCEGLISREDYGNMIQRVKQFIEGKSKKVESQLYDSMQNAAQSRQFEKAAQLRDQLNALSAFHKRQKIIDPTFAERDIIAIAIEQNDACSVVFKVREGKIIGRQHFYLTGTWNESLKSATSAFVKQYYLSADYIPSEILLPAKGSDLGQLQKWLSDKRGEKVDLNAPKTGAKARLIEMCTSNAKLLLNELLLQKQSKTAEDAMKALKEHLDLSQLPRRIEAFDISNIQGTDPVASMVCFIDGKAAKKEYRRFKIRTKSTPDDFAMMKEAVYRRYSRILKEERPLPDLILIDGGKGQLSAAMQALNDLDLTLQPIISLAKRLEEIFIPGRTNSLIIPQSPGLQLLQRIRDESHRFAITFHRSLRGKRTLTSELDTIKGIGPTRKNLLLTSFGSLENIKRASLSELQTVGKLPESIANHIYSFFHKEDAP
ncbi:excinuclease ABC subunit C [candidate division KSB1 bacterium]|nr:excinuclease ABC subunit C [candidate division KSB1 bacterium]